VLVFPQTPAHSRTRLLLPARSLLARTRSAGQREVLCRLPSSAPRLCLTNEEGV